MRVAAGNRLVRCAIPRQPRGRPRPTDGAPRPARSSVKLL